MLVFLFRCDKHWRPKYATDLFNRKLVRLWQATPDDIKVLNTVGDFREGRT